MSESPFVPSFHDSPFLPSIAASLGLVTWWVHGRIPPGTGLGDPGELATVLLGSPYRLAALVPLAVVLALGARLATLGSIVGSGSSSGRRSGEIAAPVLWGAGLPFLATFLDAASFRCTAGVLAWLGILLGTLAAWRRLRLRAPSADAAAAADGRRWRLAIAGIALLVPLALLPGWTEPAGDEPHYLLVSHSLWVDGDLDVADDYSDREYREVHPEFLWPHSRPGRDTDARYSMHGVGYPLLLTPAYGLGRALGGHWPHALPGALMALLYGLFAWVLFGTIEEIAGARAAPRGTAAAVLLGPLLFSPLYLFPEVPAMLLSCAAYRRLRRASTTGSLLSGGALLALLPWVGVKYLPLAVALGAIMALRPDVPASRRRRALAIGLPLLVALAGHAAFTWRLYGSLSPLSIYLGAGAGGRAPGFGDRWASYLAAWPGALRTAAGYLLDQREGLLAVGPHWILAVAGIPWMWRRRRWDVVALAVAAAAHVGPYAFSQQLGGQGPPVRPLMAVLWILAPPLGAALALPGGGRRLLAGLRGALLAVAAAITAVLASSPELLPHDYPVTSSWLLRHLSPRDTELWRAFPGLLAVEDPRWTVAAVWGIGAVAVAAALWLAGRRRREGSEGIGAGSGTPYGVATAAVVTVLLAAGALHLRSQTVLRDRHVGGPVGHGVEAWTAQRLPERAWIEADGIWARPGAARRFVLTLPTPVERVRVRLRTLVETPVTVTLQGDRVSAIIAPGEPLETVLEPGRGWPLDGGTALHLELQAARGAAPAELGPDRDRRILGVRLRILDVTPLPPR